MANKYQREPISAVIDELKAIVENHWSETDAPYTVDKLDPDWDAYYEMEAAGVLRLYTVRDNGNLVGYCSVILYKNIHCKNSTIATTDSLYISPSHRKSRAGYKLLRFVEADVKEQCDSFNVSMKSYLPFEDLLNTMGFSKTEIIYTKRLE